MRDNSDDPNNGLVTVVTWTGQNFAIEQILTEIWGKCSNI